MTNTRQTGRRAPAAFFVCVCPDHDGRQTSAIDTPRGVFADEPRVTG